MPARKHNMFAIKLISIIIGILGTGITLISIDWGAIVRFGTSVNFLYENVEELEHVLDDYHNVLGLGHDVEICMAEIDSLNNKLKVLENRDSLIHVISLLNRGKFPYDSIWIKSQSGHYYKTTIEKHFKEEHHD